MKVWEVLAIFKNGYRSRAQFNFRHYFYDHIIFHTLYDHIIFFLALLVHRSQKVEQIHSVALKHKPA